MLEDYLLVHKKILPDYYSSVIETKHLLEKGLVKNVSQAVRQTGISRSTYYKYKDFILETDAASEDRKAVLSMELSHEPGVLSSVLAEISKSGGSILTITQSLPIHGQASVTISVDVSRISDSPADLISKIGAVIGVENPRIIAID